MSVPKRSTWSQARRGVEDALSAAGVVSAPTQARWISEQASGASAHEWLSIAHLPVPERAHVHIEAMLDRRLSGVPIQYVLGSWQFRELDLVVDERVLIPRPETEVVVEVALAEAQRLGVRRRRDASARRAESGHVLVDLGTGSGAIALSLAAELVDVAVIATDRDVDAVEVARLNAAGNALTGVVFGVGDWFGALPAELAGRCALVVANPPYVRADEHAALDPEVRDHEPIGALVAGPSGTEALDRIVDDAVEWLVDGGALVCELAPHQAEAVSERARAGGYVDVRVEADLTGRPRVLVARRS